MVATGALNAVAAGLALLVASVAEADDWAPIGEASVTIDGATGTWWIPEREALGGGWRLEGSGMLSTLVVEAYPAPVGEPAMPKPHLLVEVTAPALRPRLTEVLWTPGDDVKHLARDGQVEASETATGWAISFRAELSGRSGSARPDDL